MDTSHKNWKLIILRGILLIALGVFILFIPKEAILDMLLYMGIIAIGNGVLLLISAFKNRKHHSSNIQIIEAIFDIFLGLILLIFPTQSANDVITLFPVFIGFGIFFWGSMVVLFALQLEAIPNSPWKQLLIGGVVTIILSFLIIISHWIFPEGSYEASIIFFGASFIFYGLVYCFLGYQLKKSN